MHNTSCIDALQAHGAAGFWLSPELTLREIEELGAARAAAGLGVCVLGYPRLMTSEHCMLQVADACIHDCERCRLRARKFSLKNIDGRLLPVRSDIRGRSHLYDSELLDVTPHIPQLMRAGISRVLVDGTLMDTDELTRMVVRARRAIVAARDGRTPDRRLPGSSSGCLLTDRIAMGVSAGLRVLYRDSWLMAVDKPAGIIVHGDGAGAPTLTDAVRAHLVASGEASASAAAQALQRPSIGTPRGSCCSHWIKRRSPPFA